MSDSRLRPELTGNCATCYSPRGGTAYLLVYTAVQQQRGLIHGKLHAHGAHCAIGSYYDVNPKNALHVDLIDEVAAVNDSVPHYTPSERKAYVLRWLKWKCQQAGLVLGPGRKIARDPR